MRSKPFARSALLATAVAAATLVASAPASATPLATQLQNALTVPGVSWNATGVVTIDLPTGRPVYQRNQTLSLRPASNEKLAVALAALVELGPTFRIGTRVLGEGRLDGSVWRGRLVLKGFGDPSLSRLKLARLAARLERAGIRSVTGLIIGDESYFDTRRTAPGWKASFYKEECPPLSALIVDAGKAGGRTVDHPALAAARAFRQALIAEGIRVPRGATTGVTSDGAATLAAVISSPVSALVRSMNLRSDNFIAEMLTKELGARELGSGTTTAGTAVMRRVLRTRGVPLAGVRLADGSGLSLYDRMTAIALAALLISAWSDPALHHPFVASLPVAGISGTLKDRLESPPARGNVRAKTGTTVRASALSGYVGDRYVFAIVQNGNPIPWWYARRGQDRFAQILAGRL
jgi:D-alanyl-D-alanine carboxypeptidase/D-alanyl-D-alanine-endopeptidase (penicillin-binding protein 4)